MNSDNRKKVHNFIERINDIYDKLNTSEKKEYYNLIKPYRGYKKILHLLPKEDVNLILKNKYDHKKNKDRVEKIIEKYNKKKLKEREIWKNKEIKRCNKLFQKKTKKNNHFREQCSKKNINRRVNLYRKLINI